MRVMNRKDVRTVIGDMCAFGMAIEEDGAMKQVRQRTKFMTNAPKIADRLARTCSKGHSHARLEGGHRTRNLRSILMNCANT